MQSLLRCAWSCTKLNFFKSMEDISQAWDIILCIMYYYNIILGKLKHKNELGVIQILLVHESKDRCVHRCEV